MKNPRELIMTIDLLCLDGCPAYLHVWSELADVPSETKIETCVRLVNIDSPKTAEAHHFAGSPTVKVEGHDFEGYAGPGIMACRVYQENEGRGWPNLLLRALTRRHEVGA